MSLFDRYTTTIFVFVTFRFFASRGVVFHSFTPRLTQVSPWVSGCGWNNLLQTVHMVGLQGKKTHVMVLWCATDTCDDIAEYFYTCAMNINRWKCSRAAFVGFHTCDPAREAFYVKSLMSWFYVWVQHKSRRPVFGPPRGQGGHQHCWWPSPPNERVRIDLLNLCTPQT